MSDAEPTLHELIQLGVQSGLQDIHVSMPGTVISYDPATKTAKVQPGIKRVIFDEDDQQVHEDLQPFENVPVMFFRCGKLSIHAELAEGDGVDLVFASDSTAEWRNTGKPVAPGDLKRLGLSSPKAYPGMFPKNNPGADTDDSIGRPGGLRIHFTDTAIVVGDGTKHAALAELVAIELNKIAAVLLTNAGAPLTYTPASVASTNLKAD